MRLITGKIGRRSTNRPPAIVTFDASQWRSRGLDIARSDHFGGAVGGRPPSAAVAIPAVVSAPLIRSSTSIASSTSSVAPTVIGSEFRRRALPSEAEALAAPLPGMPIGDPGMAAPGPMVPLAGQFLSSATARLSVERRCDIFRGLALRVQLLIAALALSGELGRDVGTADHRRRGGRRVTCRALGVEARSVQARRAGKVRYLPELRSPELALHRRTGASS